MEHKEDFGLISVIMPAFNAERTIAYAIDSVLAQTYSNLELIVINDGSVDKTAEIVRKYADTDARVRLVENEKNLGVSYTRLNGVKESRGEWIALLDSDDAWLPEKLDKQIELQRKWNAEVVFTGASYIDADGKPKDWIQHVPEQIGYRKLLKQNLITNSSAIVKKDLFLDYYAIGDEMHEDLAVWLGILRTGRKAYGVDEPLIIYRVSRSSKSGNKIHAAVMNWKTYRYINVNVFETIYYMCWYAVKGLRKHSHLQM